MKDSRQQGKLAILVGGGPAPGINSVIASATIEAVNCGLRVIGLRDGTISSDGLDTFKLGYEFVRDEIGMRRDHLKRHAAQNPAQETVRDTAKGGASHDDKVVVVKAAHSA